MPCAAEIASTRSSRAAEACGSAITGSRERRVGFHTFGCKLNQYETEAIASALKGQGFSIVPADEEAEAYIVNTCTVTARADHKARALIRGLARSRPDALLLVTGCSAQLEAASLASLAANIVIVPQVEKSRLLDLPRILKDARGARSAAETGAELRRGSAPDPFALTVKEMSFHTRAFLKVQDGCDSWCSYCRVPPARGPSVSLGAAEVVRRASRLESDGYRELVITGVNISAWKDGSLRLPDLLRSILEGTEKARIRLSSLEPESLTTDLCRILSHDRVCPHFHIPVQSGSNAILEAMKRRYRIERVGEGISLLRSVKERPFVAADIIVGFPGETEQDFDATRRAVRALGFSALHTFPFSTRPGTAAAALRPMIPERIRYQRARELASIARGQSEAYAHSWIGEMVEVLFEKGEGGLAHGISGNYLKVAVAGAPNDARGKLARVMITAARPACRGKFLAFCA
jgi:threonylcarbamoyladenosine tRNA methylthiotransferase MtaB